MVRRPRSGREGVMTSGPVGFLSDAHGNPVALRACIDALRARGCTAIYFLGDAVGYLPMAEEVLALLEAEDIPCQLGNHEAMLIGRLPLPVEKDAVYGLSALRSRLRPERLASISAWPTRREIAIAGRTLVLLHGGPSDELSEYVYPDSDLTRFAALRADVAAVGHSHFPFIRAVGSTRVIGVGSCGLPRDVGDMASCALYDPGSDRAELVRVPFDAERVLAQARAAGPVHASVAGVMRRRERAPRIPGAGNA